MPDAPATPAAVSAPTRLRHPRDFWGLLRLAGTRFMADDTFQEGAALAYYAIFALPGLIVLITRIAGALFGRDAITGALYGQVSKIVGPEGASDVQAMVQKASSDEGLSIAALVGLVTLILSATGVFASFQETLNQIWGVRSRPQRAWLKFILDRARSFSLILAVGALLLASLLAQALLAKLQSFIQLYLPGVGYAALYVGNLVTSLLITSLLFAGMFRVLPDAEIRWRDVWMGGAFTAVLFAVGKALIGVYMSRSSLGSVYGAAGTVIILLSWVFYTSQIIFFGAVLTRCYAERYGKGIQPSPHAVRVQVLEVTDDNEVRVKNGTTAPTEAVQKAAKALQSSGQIPAPGTPPAAPKTPAA